MLLSLGLWIGFQVSHSLFAGVIAGLLHIGFVVSFFKRDEAVGTLKKIQERAWEIKKELTARVRHQLRSMPLLTFYIDDTLDYVEKMEKIFKEIKKDD